eukprot:NODE_4195_length_1209_cov_42.752302_g3697_i0.p1 GENE.NODE_4195_length_1209_cov_42.752302_g3697_i0~~NODE_4195_length_1209_cov_42.752302_g3697_i0.p1  ORF type:complete len:342 (+),score=57.19 NODE_4195_length_1209_cov_42.752302_g3697_i0:53-1078(+)
MLQYEEAKKLADEAFNLYENDKVMRAASIIKNLLDQLSKPDADPSLAKFHKDLIENPITKRILKQSKDVENIRNQLKNDDGWTVQHELFGVRTLFRRDPANEPYHLIRVEGWVEAPLLHILALLCEIDLWPSWFTMSSWVVALRKAHIISQPRPTNLLCYLAASMPWPIAGRDICLEVQAVDCMDPEEEYARQIVVLIESVTSFPGAQVPPEDKTYVRTWMKSSGIILTPALPNENESGATSQRTHVQLVYCADPKMAYMPVWLMNMFMRNMVFVFLPAMRHKAKQVSRSEEYKKRIEGNPELYGFIKRRMQECLQHELNVEASTEPETPFEFNPDQIPMK